MFDKIPLMKSRLGWHGGLRHNYKTTRWAGRKSLGALDIHLDNIRINMHQDNPGAAKNWYPNGYCPTFKAETVE